MLCQVSVMLVFITILLQEGFEVKLKGSSGVSQFKVVKDCRVKHAERADAYFFSLIAVLVP